MNLEIKGESYPLIWGMGCLEIFCDAMSCDLEDIDKALNPNREQNKYLVNLILAAMKNGAELESAYEPFNVSYKEMQRFLDEAPEITLAQILEDFKASKYLGKTIAEYLFAEVAEETQIPKGSKKKLKLEK